MKKLTFIALSIFMACCFTFTACGDNEEELLQTIAKFHGTWKVTNYEAKVYPEGSEEATNIGITLRNLFESKIIKFNTDGTVNLNATAQGVNGSFVFDNGSLVLKGLGLDQKDLYTFILSPAISNNKMELKGVATNPNMSAAIMNVDVKLTLVKQ